MKKNEADVRPWVRILILVASVIALGAISFAFTGSVVPSDPAAALLVQSTLLLVVLGSLFLERYFTAPADALVNSLTALVTLFPIVATVPQPPILILVFYLVLVLTVSIVAIALQGESTRGKAQNLLYRVSVTLGNAKIVFSTVFLACVFFVVDEREPISIALLLFWASYLVIWPLGIPRFLSGLGWRPTNGTQKVGQLVRVDSPGLARVALEDGSSWSFLESAPHVVTLFDGTSRWGIPLFSESRDNGVWGTLLLSSSLGEVPGRRVGDVSRPLSDESVTVQGLLDDAFGVEGAKLLGIVREGSTVGQVRFECLPNAELSLGQIVVVSDESGHVYYQIVDAETSEEAFGGLNFGSRVTMASQVGRLLDGVFTKHDWLPAMNTPVFAVLGGHTEETVEDGKFTLGEIPGAGMVLKGSFVEKLETHTAILGVTGSGKTEFAFDLIRHAAAGGVKVICIDLTSQYAERLADLSPVNLSIDPSTAAELDEKLFDADTGKFGGGEEKRVLKPFADTLRSQVETSLKNFIDGDASLGLIELQDVSNTKATLWITEMFLSSLLRLAKNGVLEGGKVLVVVEEAHTVMPEAAFSGLGDFDSKGTIAKITQIALQGRKYGVGLLVLAQRTATVSKSVLTQCNTTISFSCIDETSIGYLSHVIGAPAARQLPNLPRLRAVAHGAWIDSEVPIAFNVPFSVTKSETGPWKAASTSSAAVARAESTPDPEGPVPF